MKFFETLLPDHLLERASIRGKEFAWPICDIPEVIEAVRLADLVNIGGQLQYRFPDGKTCECYWVEVDTFQTVSADLPRRERVERAAKVALSQFLALQTRYNFIVEGRTAFGKYIDEFEANGGDPRDAMCFVWYIKA